MRKSDRQITDLNDIADIYSAATPFASAYRTSKRHISFPFLLAMP